MANCTGEDGSEAGRWEIYNGKKNWVAGALAGWEERQAGREQVREEWRLGVRKCRQVKAKEIRRRWFDLLMADIEKSSTSARHIYGATKGGRLGREAAEVLHSFSQGGGSVI